MASDENIITNLYTKLENAIFLGDRLSSGEFGCLINPGMFIAQDYPDNPNGSDAMAVQAALANIACDSKFLFTPTTATVDGIYEELMEFRALPKSTLTPEEKREMENIRSWVNNHDVMYRKYRDLYYDAKDAYDQEANSQAPNQASLQRLQRKIRDAEYAWSLQGYRGEYDQKTARLIYLLDGDPTTFFEELRQRMEQQRKQSPHNGDYFNTLLVPHPDRWADMSWSDFSEVVNDSSSSHVSRSVSWGGGLSVGWGLWSFGGGAAGSSQYDHRRSEQRELQVKFQYARVRILRPWLKEDVFRYHFWTWKKAHGYVELSDGGNPGLNPPVRPLGDFPVLPMYMIVVRNVEIISQFSEADREFIASQWSARARISYGPFGIGGNMTKSSSEEYVKAHFERDRIFIEQPQVIGFNGTLLPQCPSPNMRLDWDTDAAFPEHEDADRIRIRELVRLQDFAAAGNDKALWSAANKEANNLTLLRDAKNGSKATNGESEKAGAKDLVNTWLL